MATSPKQACTVLIADDEPKIREVLQRFLTQRGYDPVVAADGQEALSKARARKPGVILLDVNMPRMDGFSVCQKLREDAQTRLTPILMLTARAAVNDKIAGLGTGADDYLTKPFELAELLARIEALLRRSGKMVSANPLTQLPGNPEIQEEVERRIASGCKFAVAYIDIDNFKAYNDVYGFQQGDAVIQWTSKLLQEAVNAVGRPQPGPGVLGHFLGHIGGDDFILISDSAFIRDLCDAVAARFDRERKLWYNWRDNLSETLRTRDRQGNDHNFPLMALSIAVSSNDRRTIRHYAQVAQITSELKKFIKGRAQKSMSAVVFDRRTS